MSIATMTADIGAERAARPRQNTIPRFSRAVQAADDHSGRFAGGEGITRTSAPSAGFWKVKVVFEFGGRPMLATVRAVSARQALTFALNRHPNANRSATAVLGPAS
jgi:hypothetical protein